MLAKVASKSFLSLSNHQTIRRGVVVVVLLDELKTKGNKTRLHCSIESDRRQINIMPLRIKNLTGQRDSKSNQTWPQVDKYSIFYMCSAKFEQAISTI